MIDNNNKLCWFQAILITYIIRKHTIINFIIFILNNKLPKILQYVTSDLNKFNSFEELLI